MSQIDGNNDPRLELPPDELALLREDEPYVAGRARTGVGPVVIISVLAVFAVGLFLMLNARRVEGKARSLVTPVAGATLSAPEPPLVLAPPSPAAGINTPQSLVAGSMTTPVSLAAPAPPPPRAFSIPAAFAPITPTVDPTQRRRAPTVVVDLDSGGPGSPVSPLAVVAALAGTARASDAPGSAMAALTPASAAALIAGQAAATTPAARGPQLNSDEAFAERVGEGAGTERAIATSLRDLGSVVPQGAMIPGVLETAINSDLPGFTRAIVSRDVRSFDGKHVLIPRGSRLIGQYKSAVALGQSRAFVIWTRVTRPDGVSVQIGSPGTDALGRGGLDGDVDRHFFQRFGGSILLSVLNAGANAVGGTPGTQIAIGSPGAAASAASSVLQGDMVPPTIKVAQGEAIRIFVSRDLDFSNVGPSR